MFEPQIIKMMEWGVLETLYMTLASTLLAYTFGLPLGIILVITDKSGIHPNRSIHMVLGIIINILRSIPFLILLILVFPVTQFVTGTTIGPTATVVPLVIGSAPFIARLVESSLKEINSGVIEAAESMGASPLQIMMKVMLPEAKPSLILGSAIAVTTILSYSAMAGVVAGGGLGDIAIRYGLHRYKTDIMLVTVAILVIIVQVLQEIGTRLAKRSDKRK